MVQTFRDRELSRIRQSGWVQNPRICALATDSALPSPIEYAVEVLTDEHWERAERAETLLREKFAGHRFAEVVEYGLLLVPSPARLDTRGTMPAEVRAAQHSSLGEDFLDPALTGGVDLTAPASVWTPFVSIVGAYGLSAGSYEQIAAEQFNIDGFDTCVGMTRQLWGARLLQAPEGVSPDSDYNDTWTFTLFPGKPLADGQAVSGTVLKGGVRLGKTNRGIGSVRIAPAIPILP
ncbi:MAG: hypothetical protein QM589_02785 [Thermomicrobiales bacterium]